MRRSVPGTLWALCVVVAATSCARASLPATSDDAGPDVPRTADATRTPESPRTPKSTRPPLVEVKSVIPDLVSDLRYATDNNFLGRRVYPEDAVCYLRRETVARLEKAAAALRAKGYRLRVYDCYRPLAVQWEMWRILPKPGYVADPRKGSNHNRGTAVDLTLADEQGRELEMPTPFDTFGKAAHHGSTAASPVALRHRELLRSAMEAAGFRKNRMEWWHYDLPNGTRFPVLDAPLTPDGADAASSSADAGTLR